MSSEQKDYTYTTSQMKSMNYIRAHFPAIVNGENSRTNQMEREGEI